MPLPTRDAEALDTVEDVLFVLRGLPDRDRAIDTLIETIEDDRASLHARLIASALTRRTPPVLRSVVRSSS